MSAKYDRIGDTYDTTRRADTQVVTQLRKHLGPQSDGTYLDVGCGTGNYTVAMKENGGTWSGVEPSGHMLDLARAKDSTITWRQGTAEQLPFDDGSFDGIICTLAIHHFTDLAAACHEMSRVLRPRGRLVLFTTTPEQIRGCWLTHYFPEMLKRDAEQFPDLEMMKAATAGTGLEYKDSEPFFITNDTEDFFFFSGKYRPRLYLDANVRSGMSNFRTMINEEELADGLRRLERDIEDGSVGQVIADHESSRGDYCFVVFERA